MGRTIIQDGMTFHETLTGGFKPELTMLGNPRMNLDVWGNPKIITDSWGNQVVEVDVFGNPRIPVAYKTISDVGRYGGTASAGGAGVVMGMLPVAFVAGGMYSVFATMAGAFILMAGVAVMVCVGLAALIADKASSLRLSNGMQPPVYMVTVGWVSGITVFWINFFFKTNFDVAATNYLTWEEIVAVVLPQMGLAACGGVLLGGLISLMFRSDMYHVRMKARTRYNRRCVGDMAWATFGMPVIAVIVSLLWVLVIAPIASIAMHTSLSALVDKQATAMAVCFVVTGAIIVLVRTVLLVRGSNG